MESIRILLTVPRARSLFDAFLFPRMCRRSSDAPIPCRFASPRIWLAERAIGSVPYLFLYQYSLLRQEPAA